jgi:MFS family permease
MNNDIKNNKYKKIKNYMRPENVQLFKTNSNRTSWFILAILSSTLLAVMFSETMLLPAIPEIMKDFNIPYNTAIWVFSAYLIVAAVMTPISGRLSDIYGKKKILLVLLILYTSGIIAGGFTNSILTLLISRIVQGVGLAAVPVAFSILRDVFPVKKLSIAIGVFSSAYSAGSVLGLLFGASIIQSFGWHSTFFLIAPVAAIVTTIIAMFVPSSKAQEQSSPNIDDFNKKKKNNKVDIQGGIFLSITITTFLIGLTLLETGGISNSALVLSSFGISSLSLGIFIAIEKKTKFPLIDLTMIKHKIILPSYILLFLTGITMFLIYPTIVQLVRTPQPIGFGGNAIDAGNVQLPFMITFLVFATISSFIINRFGNIKPAIIGGIFVIIGTSGLFIFHSTTIEVSINLVLMGVGLSLTNIIGWNILVSSSPKEYTGISVGVGALLFFLGMAIGPALSGIYIQMNQSIIEGIDGLFPSKESFDMIFLTAGILSIGSLVNLFILKKKISLIAKVNNN